MQKKLVGAQAKKNWIGYKEYLQLLEEEKEINKVDLLQLIKPSSPLLVDTISQIANGIIMSKVQEVQVFCEIKRGLV